VLACVYAGSGLLGVIACSVIIFVPAGKAGCPNAFSGFGGTTGWIIDGTGDDCIILPGCFYSIG